MKNLKCKCGNDRNFTAEFLRTTPEYYPISRDGDIDWMLARCAHRME